MKRPLSEIVAELQAWGRSTALDYPEIARRSGVDLSTVYRVMSGEFERQKYGAGIKKLCKFAKVTMEVEAAGEVPLAVKRAVLETWDGTPAHAKRLARAIRTLGEVTRGAVLSK